MAAQGEMEPSSDEEYDADCDEEMRKPSCMLPNWASRFAWHSIGDDFEMRFPCFIVVSNDTHKLTCWPQWRQMWLDNAHDSVANLVGAAARHRCNNGMARTMNAHPTFPSIKHSLEAIASLAIIFVRAEQSTEEYHDDSPTCEQTQRVSADAALAQAAHPDRA